VGEIEKEDGLGNAMFNAGLMKDDATFAYEILELYQRHYAYALLVFFGLTILYSSQTVTHRRLD
jgi:hypothetical protein